MSEHVLIVGIDGVRFDVLGEEPTPHLDGLLARGFVAPVWLNEVAPTISGPSWATILTGAQADVAGHTMHLLGLTPPPGTAGLRFGAR